MLVLGVVLLYFAFEPTKLFLFWHGFGERMACGMIGAFIILARVMNLFHRKNKPKDYDKYVKNENNG